MFGLTVVTPPTTEPLTLEEVQLNMRVTDSADDSMIQSLITAAREYVEVALSRALITQTLRYTLDQFPAGCIYLPRPPLVTVSSITYIDANEDSQALVANTDYRVDAYSEPGRIEPVDQWPVTDARIKAVTIQYIAGYGAASAVPQRVKQAMHLLVAHWYRHREAVGRAGDEVPMAVNALLGSAWSGATVGTFA